MNAAISTPIGPVIATTKDALEFTAFCLIKPPAEKKHKNAHEHIIIGNAANGFIPNK